MLLKLNNVNKSYITKNGVTHRALANINLSFEDTGFVFIIGKSGSGKSTLLNILGGLDIFDSGEVFVSDKKISSMTGKELDSYRNTVIGFVFQEFNLLENLTVRKNLELALALQNTKVEEKTTKALKLVDLDDKIDSKVTQLSGGQRQRVSIARALIKDPRIIIADEPTGALDSNTAVEILNTFKEISKTKLVIVVSHDMQSAIEYGDRIIEIKDGLVIRDVRRKQQGEVEAVQEETNAIITADTIIRVNKGKTLNDADLNKINEIVQKTGKKVYLNVETYKNKMKALFPNLKEAIDEGKDILNDKKINASEKDHNEDTNLMTINKDAFVPTRIKDSSLTKIDFKSGRFPNFLALKMGFSILKHKKFALTLTLITSVITLFAFSFSLALSQVELNNSLAKGIVSSDAQMITFTNVDSSIPNWMHEWQNDNSSLNLNEIRNYNNFLRSNNITSYSLARNFEVEVLNILSDIWGSSDFFRFNIRYLNQFTEIDFSSNTLNLEILYPRTGVANDSKGIIISDLVANALIEQQIKDINGNSITALGHFIDRTFAFGFDTNIIELTVDGIYQAQNYAGLLQWSTSRINQQKLLEDTMVYVNTGFFDEIYLNINGFIRDVDVRTTPTSDTVNLDNSLWRNIDQEIINQLALNTGGILSDYETLTNTIIIVNQGLATQGTPNNTIERFSFNNPRGGINLIIDSTSDDIFVYNITSSNANSIAQSHNANSMVLVSDDIFDRLFELSTPVTQLMIPIGSHSQVVRLLDSAFDYDLRAVTSLQPLYESIISLVQFFTTFFRVVGLMLLALSVLLLSSFVTQSIRITKKQIGILRALGAKKLDTFKIYALEAMIIGLIAAAIAIIGFIIMTPIVHAAIRGLIYFNEFFVSSNTSIHVIVPSLFNFILILGVAVVISTTASALSLRKFNKITPVEAISNKDE